MALLAIIFTLVSFYYLENGRNTWNYGYTSYLSPAADRIKHWVKLPDRYPVSTLIRLPSGSPKKIPKVQATEPLEDAGQTALRLSRRDMVKACFKRSWEGYKNHAWLKDELAPISGGSKNTFGGWAATLVDSLDSLWILGMKDDFEQAVGALEDIDFTTTDAREINVFETTIRYMGGFLAAYDVSGAKYPVLLKKAKEVGELLICCFDTPNRMPIPRWNWRNYVDGQAQVAPSRALVSEIGTLSLEFTRLTQLTGDPKYYDAVQRISDTLEKEQGNTRLPGMWPITVDMEAQSFKEDTSFSLGAMSDSAYEYFPKQYLLLGGLLTQPKKLYENFIGVAKERLFFRIYNPDNKPLTVSGSALVRRSGDIQLVSATEHLTCFVGGMVALASRVFDRPDELALAGELTNGCIWAYDSNVNGIGPEIYSVIPCPKDGDCNWSEEVWYEGICNTTHFMPKEGEDATVARAKHTKQEIEDRRLTPGLVAIHDTRYVLRPEAIESVFIMYRITGERRWQEAAWRMFQHVEKATRSEFGAAAIVDITVDPENVSSQRMDSMESFWLAETLKYYYLIFEDFDKVSLDEYVLNTEAHPLKRPT